jgi:Uri superfamily endonuclease
LNRPDVEQVLQPQGGTYIVWLNLQRARRIRVGSLGVIAFKVGHYAYVGSAFGPGGIRARLGRHFRRRKKMRWHIDYLISVSQVQGAWVAYGSQRLEHHWAGVLPGLAGAWLPVAGFGASDCHCETHLTGFSKLPPLNIFMENAGLPPGSVLWVK